MPMKVATMELKFTVTELKELLEQASDCPPNYEVTSVCFVVDTEYDYPDDRGTPRLTGATVTLKMRGK